MQLASIDGLMPFSRSRQQAAFRVYLH